MIKVIFFPNGNTIAFKDGVQIPDMQESWFMLYVQAFAALGMDMTKIDFTMPDTKHARVIIEVDGTLNWQIE